jgi:hypothetical protein
MSGPICRVVCRVACRVSGPTRQESVFWSQQGKPLMSGLSGFCSRREPWRNHGKFHALLLEPQNPPNPLKKLDLNDARS